jgi:hypothetical protein
LQAYPTLSNWSVISVFVRKITTPATGSTSKRLTAVDSAPVDHYAIAYDLRGDARTANTKQLVNEQRAGRWPVKLLSSYGES